MKNMRKAIIMTLTLCVTSFNAFPQTQADSAFYKTHESKWLSKKSGLWSVTMTIQPTGDSKPVIIKGLKAERSMVGAFCLHEIMAPLKGAAMPRFTRMSDLDYNLNESRWDYTSIDSRITAGIMFFSFHSATGDSITSYIQNFPHPGLGPKQTDRGKSVRLRNVFLTVDANHDVVNQYWKLTDGTEWLAITYDYVRSPELKKE